MTAPFMQLYVADYMADTRHLTCEQDGAYMRLLMAMWRAGGSLPADHAKLARIVGMSASRWLKVRDDVMAFFDEVDGAITQGRLTKEYQKAEEKSAKRSEAGKSGAEAKALKNNNSPQAIAEPLLKHSLEPEPEVRKEDCAGSGATDWPANAEVVEILITQSGLRLTNAETWHLRSAGVVALWRHNGFSFWDEVLPTIKALVDGGAKVKSWAYFTDAIAECRANRLKPIPIPEPRQTHERRNPDNRDQSAGRSTDYMREAIDLDQQRRGAKLDRASGF